MKYQLAPLEGITTYIYRNAFAKCYGGIDEYFTPFISPHKDKTLNQKEINEITPENNQGICLVPQILTNSAQDFLKTVEEIKAYGYQHVNLNFGCPSGTVTSKKKGAGILQDTRLLEAFLDEIFEKATVAISIKTRIGFWDEDEWPEILKIYEKFPIKELIIHPRVRQDFYKNDTRKEAFLLAYQNSHGKLVYNGNLFSRDDIEECIREFPNVDGIMLGRGLIACPNLLNEIRQNSLNDLKVLKTFHDEVYQGYCRTQSGDRNVLYRMKELWFYLSQSFEEMPKLEKEIKKAQKCHEYEMTVQRIFREIPLKEPEKRKIRFS